MKRKILVASLFIMFSFSCFILAQDKEFISYKIDGKKYNLDNVTLQYHNGEEWVSVHGSKIERIELGSGLSRYFREIEVSIGMNITGDEQALVGKHEAAKSDEMPVSLTWYEWIDKKKKELKVFYIHQDDSGESTSIFTVIFENFGPAGSMVQGTFSGKLVDDEGKVYQITEGKFAVKRTDVE